MSEKVGIIKEHWHLPIFLHFFVCFYQQDAAFIPAVVNDSLAVWFFTVKTVKTNAGVIYHMMVTRHFLILAPW